jgi:imidazolonepropionase-like amidohydrolase
MIDSLVELERAGLTRLEALRAGTYGGARLLGLQDALGLVRPGYRADLIAVAGEPDRDLRELAALRWLMIDGVLQELNGPRLGSSIAGRVALGWATR